MSIHTASGFSNSNRVIDAINVGTPENGISATYQSGDSNFFIKYNSKNIVQLRWASGSGNSGFCVGGAYGDSTNHYVRIDNGANVWYFDREISGYPGSAYYTAITVTTTAKGLCLDYSVYHGSYGTWRNTLWIVIGKDNNPQYFVHNEYTNSPDSDKTLAYNLTADKKINYTPTITDATCTSIANWCTAGDPGQYTVMEDLFFYVCRQYPNAGIIELNGDLYYTNGTILLLDGPMT